jgi:hypothetical protein
MIDRVLNTDGQLDDPLPIGYRHRSRRDALEQCLAAGLETALDRIGSAELGEVADREQSRRLARPPIAGRISSNVLLDRLDADAVIRWVGPEPLARVVDDTDGRLEHWDGRSADEYWTPRPASLTIRLGDRTLTVPITALDALRALSDGHPVRVGDLPGLDEPSRIVLAKRLVREAACIVDGVD